MTRHPRRAFAAATVVLALLTACKGEVSVGDDVIAESEVESEAAKQLAAEVNQPEPDIDCPDDLDAKVGAEMECVLSVEGDDKRFPVSVKVTSIDDEGENAKFDVEVGTEPLSD